MRPRTSLLAFFALIRGFVQRHIRVIATICILLIFTIHLPKPTWLCCSRVDDKTSNLDLSFPKLPRKLRFGEITPIPIWADRRGISELPNNVFQMFPLYAESTQHEKFNEINQTPKRAFTKPKVQLFTLRNFDFRNFNRFWENYLTVTEVKQTNQFWQQEKKQNETQKSSYNPGAVLRRLRMGQELPECITLRFLRPLQPPTKICVHSPKEDNFISKYLRDVGQWEPDLLDQMQTFFEHHPTAQLVDLGCNIGVYSLLAARLGRPVLAVDALPANLALLELSLLTNDEAALDPVMQDDVEDLLQSIADARIAAARGKSRRRRHQIKSGSAWETWARSRRFFGELVTTVHNAVYSKRTRMFVDITDDRNLGGMKVKELHTNQGLKSASLKQGELLGGRAVTQGQAITIKNTDEINSVGLGPISQQLLQQERLRDGSIKLGEKEDASPRVVVDAICLDDLVPYVKKNLSVFLKMDIEGAEDQVLQCANDFFSSLDVRVVQMEILFQRYSGHLGNMNSFFERHNLWPSEDVSGKRMLGPDTYMWPANMYWIKVR
ncbi:hypothetical protein PoB_002970900 [Plakobranchus ocellatus]|uniref:Methyltransferase FkbM domain-containing protein n=1 Tax=Plakobranchus ocellatus TaxID=259542 RepID=A0AAV4A9R6_9GAST|nr:hypothetical protein PoB_002970900 [Plakobranchus ocellatus]